MVAASLDAAVWEKRNETIQEVFVPGQNACRLTPGTAVLAASGTLPSVHLRADGKAAFFLKVAPEKENFLTIVYWGGDAGGQRRPTAEGGEITLGNPGVDVFAGGQELDAESAGQGNEYEILRERPCLPGGWFLRTYRIPRDCTDGHQAVEFILEAKKSSGGAYAKVGGSPPQPASPELWTRGIFSAFTHTGNFFEAPVSLPPPWEKPPSPAAQAGEIDFASVRKRLIEQIDGAVGILVDNQLYGPEFERAAKELGIPPAVHGLFDKDGLKNYLTGSPGTERDWKTPLTGSASGRTQAVAAHLMLRAYGLPGSKYERNDEMVSRALAALDGYCRYQGRDGGFEIGGGQAGWVGGPQRKTTRGGLQGFFVLPLADACLALAPHFEANPGLLAQTIDSDGDGRPDQTRRDAYAAMFEKYLRGQGDLRGGVANQARINAIAAIRANEAFFKLQSRNVLPMEDLRQMAREATGLAPHESTGNWQLSRKGVGMEKGGMCPAYAQHAFPQFPLLIEAIDDPDLEQSYRLALRAISFCVFPAPDGKLLVKGPVGSRKHPFPGEPLHWIPLAWSAVRFNDDFSRIAVYRGLRQFDISDRKPMDLNRLGRDTLDALTLLRFLPDLEAGHPPADDRLPVEKPDEFVFSDAQASLAALHRGDATVYLQGERYHLIRPEFQAFGAAAYEGGPEARIDRFGPWTIVRNLSETFSMKNTGREGVVQLPPDATGSRRRQVLSPGQTILLPGDIAGIELGEEKGN